MWRLDGGGMSHRLEPSDSTSGASVLRQPPGAVLSGWPSGTRLAARPRDSSRQLMMRRGGCPGSFRNPPMIPAPPADTQLIALRAKLGTNERERRRVIAMIVGQPDTRAALARAVGTHPDLTRLTAERRVLIQDISGMPTMRADGLKVKGWGFYTLPDRRPAGAAERARRDGAQPSLGRDRGGGVTAVVLARRARSGCRRSTARCQPDPTVRGVRCLHPRAQPADGARQWPAGDPAVEAQIKAIVGRRHEMRDTIAALPATASNGHRAKAAFVLHYMSADADHDADPAVSRRPACCPTTTCRRTAWCWTCCGYPRRRRSGTWMPS